MRGETAEREREREVDTSILDMQHVLISLSFLFFDSPSSSSSSCFIRFYGFAHNNLLIATGRTFEWPHRFLFVFFPFHL